MNCFLGIDLGSSSVKAALVRADDAACLARSQSPEDEMVITSPEPGFAEQAPNLWWHHLAKAVRRLAQQDKSAIRNIRAIGISYQMHGLVLVDHTGHSLRPSIIWCDGRASEIGRILYRKLGQAASLSRYLNAPGNFTASKLRWVILNEPYLKKRIGCFLLPGDYLALRLTGKAATTPTGLSEMVLWDTLEHGPAIQVLKAAGIRQSWLPDRVPTFGVQGRLTGKAAKELGLPPGIPLTYRAGDQPNNALSLNALEPGEAAATAGTSGVIFAVSANPLPDRLGRFNTFLHVNHSRSTPRFGSLLCLNGCGSLYSWLRRTTGAHSYAEMNTMAESVPPGADGLNLFPFGNGPERLFGHLVSGASMVNLDFNRHTRQNLYRAAQEAIAFAFRFGASQMERAGLPPITHFNAGNANLFKSRLFCQLFASIMNATLKIYDTDGAQGAARGAWFGLNPVSKRKQIFGKIRRLECIKPDPRLAKEYAGFYQNWKIHLKGVSSET